MQLQALPLCSWKRQPYKATAVVALCAGATESAMYYPIGGTVSEGPSAAAPNRPSPGGGHWDEPKQSSGIAAISAVKSSGIQLFLAS